VLFFGIIVKVFQWLSGYVMGQRWFITLLLLTEKDDNMAGLDVRSEEFKDKVLGCWLGKNIGGTLGAPFEWKRQINDVSFYTQELKGEPLPNDDLDIQLLWLIALEWDGLDLSAERMAEYWCQHVTPHWAEYGTAKINMRSGLLPPLCGDYRNDFKHSCGAFIRSEIWACIAAGMPLLATQYAYKDAILDHGHGEGTWAALFTAALESAAFVETDFRALIEIALSYLPEDCGTAQAVRLAIKSYDDGLSWQDTRDEILREHRGKAMMGQRSFVSDADLEKGFFDGELGYDAPSNIAIIVLAMLYGEGDFDKTMCLSVNCGEDTDCTGATVGSLWGIIYGAKNIPERWIEPIGRGIKTLVLNLGDLGGAGVPQTVDELTERTIDLAAQLQLASSRRNRNDWFKQVPNPDRHPLSCDNRDQIACGFPNGPIFEDRHCRVALDYVDGPVVRSGEPVRMRVRIDNPNEMQANFTLRWYLPEGWEVTPGVHGVVQSLSKWMGEPVVVEYTFIIPQVTQAMNRATLEITAEGRPLVKLIPLTLLNETVGLVS
jgi:ADP-ribosylglycohydrolase